MLAICGSDALRELSSPGKSGSFFYLTQDDRFIIKTVKKSEVKVRFHIHRQAKNSQAHPIYLRKILSWPFLSFIVVLVHHGKKKKAGDGIFCVFLIFFGSSLYLNSGCAQVLIKMLPSYFQHVCQYKSSLVTKFYGVHCVKPIGGQKVR